MGTFGTDPFSSDGAMDFLEELAEQPPDGRAAELERLFLLVRNQPDLLGREFFPDEVVAAAAIVAATLPFGRQFSERLESLAENDLAPDVRLGAPAPRLASIAREALLFVAGPWQQGWVDDTDAAEARDTIAELSRVLAGGGLDELDHIWNEATDSGADGEMPEGTPPGIEHLASLLRVYNSAMSGGLGFALEVNEPFHVRRAINALRYFGLTETASFVEEALNGESPGDAFFAPVDHGIDPIGRAFRTKAAEFPTDFGRA
ncbi:hypothetical protein Ais01nite_06100 [Asanoa ishikariensis]|uniref:Uncharacterized protein n=1 Tax=Asanoa ishikariensis TaxID=137265 RepID=A0A1H3TEJ3_9ACTN|nr:DUF4259 domain-containing protein [Asanoa ishikariensis]GIF62575.1 hypothetical protein Ais01nite_06100 [Asanoa ishikariensis]SDZ48664.1 protein of unknown function [Asanoa ishikariensis]